MYTWFIAIPITLLLLWLAWRRPNRQRLALRMVASIVAGVSLVLLVFPPNTQQAINPSAAILLTQGYNRDTLEALLKQQEAKPTVYTLGTTADGATPLTSLYTLRQQQPSLQTLHVLGYGLEEQQLQALKNVQLMPHLANMPAGVSAAQWPQEATLGEAVTVAGKYKAAGATTVYLHAASQLRDSLKTTPDSTYTFNLRYIPKTTGHQTYFILARTKDQTDTLGQVPVQVKAQQQLKVLLLASAPSFEFKFLKNHLAEQQHQVAYRATVSKGISQSEWLNMAKTDLGRISPKLLQQFDVVITEPQALQSISAGERATLQRAVAEDGLGVLTIATEPANTRSTSFFTNFQSKRLSQQDTRSTRASWAGQVTNTTSAAPFTLVGTTAVNSLIAEQGNSMLAGAKKAGWGKVALSYLPQTYPWLLEGNTEAYASYWATLLSAIAREQVKDRYWQLETPQVPHPHQQLTLTFTDYTLTANAPAPTATITSLTDSVSTTLPLAQHMQQQEKYSGSFWPIQTGWHKAEVADAAPFFFYVQAPAHWQFESIASKLAATQAFATQQNTAPGTAPIAYREEPVTAIWFFLLFVLSSGFLWLEEKL